MGVKFGAARVVGAASSWGLKHVFRRPAGNFPGKIALYLDPELIADLRGRLASGSICVVGTNGKTTVTNMLADALEAGGMSVVCNRTGANLDSGVATVLLESQSADWGIFECDELWLSKILPFLQSEYCVLLNLFRDQLDRVGEIDYIQNSIIATLRKSPSTVLIYNADDPMCQSIADEVDNPKIPIGTLDVIDDSQAPATEAQMCQKCDAMLEYGVRQYGLLGDYHCSKCDFGRSELTFGASDISISETGSAFTIESGAAAARVTMPYSGSYMVYNVLAVCTAGLMAGLDLSTIQQVIDVYDPQNGRLQSFNVVGRSVLTNLAKNPVGFDQNIRLALQGDGPKAVAFFVNDKEGDGRDVSWLWDIDFEALANRDDVVVYAGGMRRNDLQVRLKYAGVDAKLVEGGEDTLRCVAADSPEARVYLIANYTALPIVKAELDRISADPSATVEPLNRPLPPTRSIPEPTGQHLTIAHLFPSLLNLYGDAGNVTILADRARWRGIDVEVKRIEQGDPIDFSTIDIVCINGGPEREQYLASQELLAMGDELRAYVEDDGVLLAICGGFQMIGRTWPHGDETAPGLGLVGLATRSPNGKSEGRLVDDVVLRNDLASLPIIGYENHAGRTQLDSASEPFGRVIGSTGCGNNERDKADGVLYRNVIGSYLHGPLLSKNPEIADELLVRALKRRAQREGVAFEGLPKLDDTVEKAANAFMCDRLGIR